jgi:aminoglycoside N3'-acetyltransferase
LALKCQLREQEKNNVVFLRLTQYFFSKVSPVEGGPRGLIEALLAAHARHGTLAMPSMSDDDDQPFNPRKTDCQGMGIVSDTFWRLPGLLPSDSPHAFAAIGPRVAEITAPHPVDAPHGLDSAVDLIYEHDGYALLLGVGHDANTTIHLAENMAGVRYRRPKYVTLLRGGQPMRYDYGEIDHCCQKFNLMDRWLEAEGLKRRGIVGHAEARLTRLRDIVEVALGRLRENETIFLHAVGVDIKCDEARAGLAGRPA